jgi:hypothetical protein
MEKETIVQFVWFETADNDEFLSQWDEYSKDIKKIQSLKLQQEIGKKRGARFLSQHSCFKDDFKFVFKKERRSPHVPEFEMKIRQLGGYSATEVQCKNDSRKDENKMFLFLTGGQNDVDALRKLSHYRFLNIYEAYFESSSYNYILEFFIENKFIAEFTEQLKTQHHHFESGMYKECLLQSA